ncbi:MAG: porin [Gemmataceae bacterium]
MSKLGGFALSLVLCFALRAAAEEPVEPATLKPPPPEVLPAKAETPAPSAPPPPKVEAPKSDTPKVDPPKADAPKSASRKVTGTWNNGLTFETEDKAFRMNIGGVTQFDMGWYNADQRLKYSVGSLNNLVDPGQALQDGMDFRRARLRMSGIAYEQIEFFAQYEFANSIDLRQRTLGIPNPAGVANPNVTNFDPADGIAFNEVYIGLIKLPVIGNVRVGRHRESLNFVTATADNYQVWMERGAMFEAFNGNNNFSNGVTTSRNYLDGRAYSLFGFFMQNNNNTRQISTVGDGAYVYDGRLTCLPVWDEEEKLWVHLGADYSYRNLYQDNTRYRVRPDVRVGTSFQVMNIIDSGNIFSPDALQVWNLEFASAWKKWTFAAEGSLSSVTNAYTGGMPAANGTLPAGVTARGTYVATGGYVELLRFLTNDHRPYVKERPGYGRVVPTRRFIFREDDNGCRHFDIGAWEVGVRYDYANLTHGGINGGVFNGLTAAVNWYWSSNARMQLNATWMRRSFDPTDTTGRVNGDITALGVRFNMDF